jgi:hypothetical protein
MNTAAYAVAKVGTARCAVRGSSRVLLATSGARSASALPRRRDSILPAPGAKGLLRCFAISYELAAFFWRMKCYRYHPTRTANRKVVP